MNGITGQKLLHPYDAVAYLQGYARKRQEHFGIILVDSGRNVIRKKNLFVGTESLCLIDSKIVFWAACAGKASGVILYHNHPTGDCEPSEKDIKTTESLAEGFKCLGIQLLDHVIIGKYRYFSFLEHDLLKPEESASAAVAM